jgi:hypothetical protein
MVELLLLLRLLLLELCWCFYTSKVSGDQDHVFLF